MITAKHFVAVLLCTLSWCCNSIQQENGIVLQDGNNYGDNPYHGRVELCLNGRYGTLCHDTSTDTSDRICNVICTQLGYTTCDGISDPSYAPSGTGTIWLSNIECDGTEIKITDCAHDIVNSNDTCDHDHDITIQCSDYIGGCDGGFISTECVVTPAPTQPTYHSISRVSNDMKPTTKRPTNNPTAAPVCIVATDAPTDITSDPTSVPTEIPTDSTSNPSIDEIADSKDIKQWWILTFDYKYLLTGILMVICLCCCLCLNVLLLAKPKKDKKSEFTVYGERHGGTLMSTEEKHAYEGNEGEIEKRRMIDSFAQNMQNIVGANQILMEDVVETMKQDKGFVVDTKSGTFGELPPAPSRVVITDHGGLAQIQLDDGNSSDEAEKLYDATITSADVDGYDNVECIH